MKFLNFCKKNFITIVSAAIIGFSNGFFGGGGGILCVPYFEEYLKYDEKVSHATTMCVVLPFCICSSVVYILENTFRLEYLGLILLGAIFGSILGVFFFKKISGKIVKFIFAILLFCCGVKMVIF